MWSPRNTDTNFDDRKAAFHPAAETGIAYTTPEITVQEYAAFSYKD